jgi:hypothetical protein
MNAFPLRKLKIAEEGQLQFSKKSGQGDEKRLI